MNKKHFSQPQSKDSPIQKQSFEYVTFFWVVTFKQIFDIL